MEPREDHVLDPRGLQRPPKSIQPVYLRHNRNTCKAILFVKEGQMAERTPNNCSAGLLSTAQDWAMTDDLERKLRVPILITQCLAQERKREKCQKLVEECWRNGWRTRCMSVEVGSLGFASHSLSKAYGTLGITGAKRRRAMNKSRGS